MRDGSQGFSATVELPCRMFCGPDARLELSGVALRIDTGSLVLALEKGSEQPYPELGEQVQLELLLPVNAAIAENVKAKCLSFRACVTQVTEMPDGSRRIGMSFRKAVFRDRKDDGVRKPPKRQAATGWKM